MSDYILDFELPLREIEVKIDSLKSTGIKTGMDVSDGIKLLEEQLSERRKIIYQVFLVLIHKMEILNYL